MLITNPEIKAYINLVFDLGCAFLVTAMVVAMILAVCYAGYLAIKDALDDYY